MCGDGAQGKGKVYHDFSDDALKVVVIFYDEFQTGAIFIFVFQYLLVTKHTDTEMRLHTNYYGFLRLHSRAWCFSLRAGLD